MSINWYRRIFVTDMANRTVNTPYNTMSTKEWYSGWSQMLVPGIYERGIFGDLLLPGISCGTKKILLIFNTHPDSPHDPIYVVSPGDFNVEPDTEIPVVLCYNMSHYESLEPCTDEDLLATVNLVKEYRAGQYIYSKKDIPSLISPLKAIQMTSTSALSNKDEKKLQEPSTNNLGKRRNNNTSKETNLRKGEKASKDDIIEINQDEIKAKYKKKDENIQNADATKENLNQNTNLNHLCYQLKNKSKESPIKVIGDKMECPFCKIVVKNMKIHFERKFECGNKVDIGHFSTIFVQYKKRNDQEKNRLYQQRYKEKDPDKYKKEQEEARNRRKNKTQKNIKRTKKMQETKEKGRI